jgi:hypothetical protein
VKELGCQIAMKSMRNIVISREKSHLFLNLCSRIIISLIFLIIFANKMLNVVNMKISEILNQIDLGSYALPKENQSPAAEFNV